MIRLGALVFLSVVIFSQTFAAGISYQVTYNIGDFEFRQENGYDIIEHPDCSPYLDGDLGSPQVLVEYHSFIIPVGDSVESITINSVTTNQFPGKYDLFPVQPACYYSKNCDPMPEWVEPDSEYYGSNDPYPSEIVVLDRTGLFDGANHIATVRVFPVYYKALDRDLFYYSYISFTINTGGTSGKTPIYVQVRMRNDQKPYDIILSNTVKNPQDIPLYGYRPPLSDTSIAMDVPTYRGYSYIIVTYDSLSGYWDPFVDWLNRKGKRARVISIQDIVSYNIADDPQINDHADLLRGYLKHTYLRGTVWVILGGSCKMVTHPLISEPRVDVPLRYFIKPTWDYYPSGNPTTSNNWRPSDIYFSELNTDWELDGDGHPGEYSHHEWEPSGDNLRTSLQSGEELYLGRIPVINGEDIERWVQKILNYEQNPGNGDYNYLTTAYWDVADQMQDNEQIDDSQAEFPGYFSHIVDEELDSYDDPSPTYPYAQHVIDNMSSYPAFVNWHHHGDFYTGAVRSAGVLPDGTAKSRVYASDWPNCMAEDSYCHMEDLDNLNKPGFLFSTACRQAGFDYPSNIGYKCLGGDYVLTSGGGVGFIGTSRFSYVGRFLHAQAKKYFLRFLFNNDPKIGPSKTLMNAEMLELKYLTNWTLFGSPEMPVWTDIPEHFSVEPNYTDDKVTVSSGGVPIEGAQVCFSSRDLSRYYIDTTDVDGNAEIGPEYDFDMTTGTNITVTMNTYMNNYIPYQIIGAGDIEMDMVWRGDIAFYGIVEIPFGKTLVIKPGTTIKTNSEIIVSGNLKIEGDANHHVILTSAEEIPEAGDWFGIRALSGSDIYMSHSEIRNAEYGIWADDAAMLVVENCTIKDNLTAGIYMKNAPRARIENSRIEDSGTYGIYCFRGSFTASGNTIASNRYGIYYFGDDNATIEDCLITYPSASPISSYYGICARQYLGTTPSCQVLGDSITGFDQGGILFNGVSSTGLISNTRVVSCGIYGILYNNTSAAIKGTASARNYVGSNSYGLQMGSPGSPDIRYTTFEENLSTSAYVGTGCSPDFGNLVDWGYNSFIVSTAGPGYYHLYNDNFSPVDAIGNYWEPLDGNLIFNANYIPYLPRRPKVTLDGDRTELAEDFELAKAYPNPFNPSTIINFNLSSPEFVTVKVFNIMGQEVRTVFAGYGSTGENSIVWDGKNHRGESVSAGVYLVQLRTSERQRTIKTTVLK